MALSTALRERSLVIIILAVAFLFRFSYATHLSFESDDEIDCYTLAKGISLQPDHFVVPIGSEKLLHPPLSQYLIKIGFMMGGISPLTARLPFILLGTLSLLFIYLLAREGLEKRGALIALLLAGFDQYLIQMSVLMTDRVYISFIPPALYFFYRGISSDKTRHFVWLGIALGLGYLGKESILLLLLGFGLFLLLNARERCYFLRPHIYLAMVTTMVIILPNVIWNLVHGVPSIERYVMKFQAIGFSPRVIALYLGELIIASLSPAYVFLNSGYRVWSEAQVTPHWVTGSLCLFATMWALREWRKDFFQLLLLVFCSEVLVVSFISANEDLNSFWWASGSYVCALVMAAHFLDRISTRSKIAFCLIVVLCSYVMFRGWLFVQVVDDCGHFLSKEMRELCRINQTNRDGHYPEAEKLSLQFLQENPRNDMGHLFLGETYFYQQKYEEAAKEYEAAYALNPQNMMVPYFQARIFVAKEQLDKAVVEMFKALNLDLQNYTLHYHLAIIYNAMGNLDGALEELGKAIKLKSDKWENYGFMAALNFRKGNYREARRWIDGFRKFYPNHQEALDMVRRLEVMGY